MIQSDTRAERFADLYNRGLKLLESNREEEAMRVMFQAATLAPDGWLAVATEQIKQGQSEVALQRLREVLAITKVPKIRAAALNNIGMILAGSGQNESALAAFEDAARIAPEFPDTYNNIALIHKWKKDYRATIRYATMALERDPWHEQAQFVRAMALLMDGQYGQGWEEYECRWRSRSNGLSKIASPFPEWDGTNGKRLFVYGEQGHGDSLLMLRYAREIRARGMWQAWVAQKSMAPLLRTIPEIDQVLEVGDVLPDFDCHLPSVSLPRILRTRIDSIPGTPYIPRPDVQRGDGLNVGICWRGSKVQANDLFRSTRLDEWRPVFAVDGVNFHSLQVDGAEEGLVWPMQQYDKPADWLETARRVAAMDLVISVDTSIVHLAGAMGVPCWCALHCRPYFVYPTKFPDSTPWYQSVRLYRQQKELQWEPVFQQIATDLATLSSSRLGQNRST